MLRHGVRVTQAIVRTKLAATAIAATILAVLMTALTLQTMRTARDVETSARASYERMRSLWRLQDAAKQLQKLSYRAAGIKGGQPDEGVAAARREFDSALAEVLSRPQRALPRWEFVQQLKAQAHDLTAQIERGPEIARHVEEVWRTSGYRASLAELTDSFAPYDAFLRTITSELSAEGRQFSNATQRSAASQGLVRALTLAMLVFGLLMAVTLFFMLQKRLALQKTHLALSAEDERRRAFLVDASHELRLPITIIRGEAEVALRQETGARTETIEALERILSQTRSVTRLLEDMFLIARAEAGGLRINLQRIDAGTIARNTACDFSTLACEAGATVLCHCESNLMVLADADRLRQALAALIDNALRHTREGVIVRVEARAEAGNVVLSVSDDGPGIDPAMAAELFQRFRRGRTRSEGSGLGLAVVRALTEAFGGTVRIEKAAIGARICLTLPRAPSAAAAQEKSTGGTHELSTAGGR